MVSTTPAFSFDAVDHSVRARADANPAALSSPHATDEVPLWVRGVLLLLILVAHLAGLVALSNMNGSQTDVRPSVILRAGWIVPEAVPDTAPGPSAQPSPSVAQQTPVVQPTPTRVATPGRRTRARPDAPQVRRQTFAPPQQSPEPEPTAENSPPSTPTRADIAAAVEVMTSGEAGSGEKSGKGERGERGERATGGAVDGEIVAPDFKANYLSNPEPEYPSLSRRLREQGAVKLRVHVTEQGRADEVTLHESSGYGRLDKAAADAVWRWRFSPARRAGAFVAAWVVVPIKFELRD